MVEFELREVFTLEGRLVASCASTEATQAARRLLRQPETGRRLTVSHVDHAAGVITVRGDR